MAAPQASNLPRTRPNFLYAILSVALVLFLLGFFGMAIIQANSLVDFFRERVNILVELEEGTTETAIDSLRLELDSSLYAKPNSVVYISKDEAFELLREDFGDDFQKLDLPNPLYDVFTFNVNANYLIQDSLVQIRRALMRHDHIRDVFYQESLINEIARNIDRIAYLALVISIFFIFVAIMLIHNTIRLALYANRFLIKNMELVGASWGFISRPYLMRSAIYGLLSAILAIVALLLIWFFIQRELPQISGLGLGWQTGALFLGLITLGILITTSSTFYVVNKYLKMRVDDLY